jgi:hypothetical protein
MTTAPVAKKVFRQRIAIVKLKIKDSEVFVARIKGAKSLLSLQALAKQEKNHIDITFITYSIENFSTDLLLCSL